MIEDHTHDPFAAGAFESRADWCVASLRKSLPLPDGAALWSPKGNELPPDPAPDEKFAHASLEKLAAMVLKGRYLEGHAVDKKVFRELALSGEIIFGETGISAMTPWSRTLLGTLPWKKWREQRRENHALFSNMIGGVKGLEILQPENAKRNAPFCAAIVFTSNKLREKVRADLMAQNIYPFILWPIEEPVFEGISDEAVDFSRRMLCLHCDMRYGKADMQRVATALKKSAGK